VIPTDVATPPIALAELISKIGRGSHGASDLSTDSAKELFAAMLDGAAPPLELGAVLLAYRVKGESVAELIGFMAALSERMAHLEVPADGPRPVVLPTYNGARRLPNLTALLALLLRRYRVPVLLHGPVDADNDFGRVTTVAVLSNLGIEPARSVAEAQQQLLHEGITYAPIALLAPGLAELLALRRRLGVRSTAHTVAKLIDPFGGAGFRIVSVTHPDYLKRMREFLTATHADALLLRGTEGEPFANPRRQPQLECFAAGVGTILFEAEPGTLTALPSLPGAIDAATAAAWIAAAVAGEHPVPQPIVNELACCLHATRQVPNGA
jgi:anthranilate phosphoribosyltransferase